MYLFCWTQRKIFWRMWETEPFWGTSIFVSNYGSQWCPKTARLQTSFRISSCVFSWTKTFKQVLNYLRVSKWWQNFHFWENYPYNVQILLEPLYTTKVSTVIFINTSVTTVIMSTEFSPWIHLLRSADLTVIWCLASFQLYVCTAAIEEEWEIREKVNVRVFGLRQHAIKWD